MNVHPIVDELDISDPLFIRTVDFVDGSNVSKHVVRLWAPVPAPDGGWLCAVSVSDMPLPELCALPGDDPLDAFITALAFLHDTFDRQSGTVKFGKKLAGGIPAISEFDWAN